MGGGMQKVSSRTSYFAKYLNGMQPRGYARFGGKLEHQVIEAPGNIRLSGLPMFSSRSPISPNFVVSRSRMQFDNAQVVRDIKSRAKRVVEQILAVAKLKKIVRQWKQRRE